MSDNLATLSVVMVGYNVKQYVVDAVESVLNQQYRRLELIFVDDGSEDGTAEFLMKKYDGRITVITTNRVGLAAARNIGATKAGGDYLAFVDADDMVTVDGYQRMINSLNTSNSDMAAGRVVRLDDRNGNRYVSRHFKKGIKAAAKRVTIYSRPELVYDSTAWNKVYRMSFYKQAGAEFPVGKLYEDIPTVLGLYLRAQSVDLLTDIVYIWRLRDGGYVSITQDRLNKNNISNRLEMLDLSYKKLEENQGTDQIVAALDYKVLNQDIYVHIADLGDASKNELAEYRNIFIEFIGRHNLWNQLPKLPLFQRVVYQTFLGKKDDLFYKFTKIGHANRIKKILMILKMLYSPIIVSTVLNIGVKNGKF